MEFAHFCLLLLLLMRYNNHENKIDGVATEIVEATSQRLANPDGACKKNIHIVTHLWKRICNFKNVQIIGISSPNAPTIICYLAQDEQVKQQCFKFWSHLILIKRDTQILEYFARLFRLVFQSFLTFCPSICLRVSGLSALLVGWSISHRSGTLIYRHPFSK